MDIAVVRVSSLRDDILVALVTVKRFLSRLPHDRLELLVAVLRLSTRHPFLEE